MQTITSDITVPANMIYTLMTVIPGTTCNYNSSVLGHTHIHTQNENGKTSDFYPLNWTTVLGDELTVWLFFSCLDSKGAKKTPPQTDHRITAQNALTDTQIHTLVRWAKKPAQLLLT